MLPNPAHRPFGLVLFENPVAAGRCLDLLRTSPPRPPSMGRRSPSLAAPFTMPFLPPFSPLFLCCCCGWVSAEVDWRDPIASVQALHNQLRYVPLLLPPIYLMHCLLSALLLSPPGTSLMFATP